MIFISQMMNRHAQKLFLRIIVSNISRFAEIFKVMHRNVSKLVYFDTETLLTVSVAPIER